MRKKKRQIWKDQRNCIPRKGGEKDRRARVIGSNKLANMQ